MNNLLDAYSESVASKLKAILDDCSSVGYTVVSFSEAADEIYYCKHWKDHSSCTHMVFAYPDQRIEDWPAIWRICSKHGIDGGSEQLA